MAMQLSVPGTLDEEARALVAGLQDRATSLVIVTREQYAAGGLLVRDIKSAARTLEDRRKAITAPLDAAKKSVLDLFRAPTDALAEAEGKVKRALAGYETEERLRAEAAAQAERERLQREEEERRKREEERLAAEAEERRLAALAVQAEANRKAEEARQAVAEAPGSIGAALVLDDAHAAQERAEEATKRAEQERREAEYQEALRREEALRQAARVKPVEPTRLAGVTYRTIWRCEVEDAVKVPREYLIVDEAKIRAVVKASKGTLGIPGVRIWSEQSVAVGGA